MGAANSIHNADCGSTLLLQRDVINLRTEYLLSRRTFPHTRTQRHDTLIKCHPNVTVLEAALKT